MSNNSSNDWWSDYEKDESILIEMCHSLHLELDDEPGHSTPPPTYQATKPSLFFSLG